MLSRRRDAALLAAAWLLATGLPALPGAPAAAAQGAIAAPGAAAAQSLSLVGPPFAEVENAWRAFWDRLRHGDIAGARRYVHTSRQPLFPGRTTVDELKELARQMASCRLDPAPVALDDDEVVYSLVCQHDGETAESLVGLRRDGDGVWRFNTL